MNEFEPKVVISELLEHKGGIWFMLLAMWGGTANYIHRLRKDGGKFRTAELVGEWAISGFSGVLTGYLCFEFGMSWPLTCFMVGVSGHMGGRAISFFEDKFKLTFGR